MRSVKDLMQMFGLNNAIDQLTMTIRVHRYVYMLRTEDSHVLRWALELEVEV